MVCDGPILFGQRKGEPAKGTAAGFARHHRADEAPCDACREGKRVADASRWPERRVGEWCRRRLHRMVGDNVTRGGACRTCSNAAARNRRRRSSECTKCGEWFVGESYDHHQYSPPGDPNQPLCCYPVSDLRSLGFKRMAPQTPGGVIEVTHTWKYMPRPVCNQGHSLLGADLYVSPTGKRACKRCVRLLRERWKTEPRPPCTIAGCPNRSERKTLSRPCQGHRLRLQRFGDALADVPLDRVNHSALEAIAIERGLLPPKPPKPPRTHCIHGHEWTNVYIAPDGVEYCRACRVDVGRRRNARKKASR